MPNKKIWSQLSMIAIVALAAMILLNFVLKQIGGNLGDIVGLITHIITIVALVFVAIYAFEWVSSQRGKNKTLWVVIYFISIIVIGVFYFLGWLA